MLQAGGYRLPFFVISGLCIVFIIPTLLLLKSTSDHEYSRFSFSQKLFSLKPCEQVEVAKCCILELWQGFWTLLSSSFYVSAILSL